MKWLLTIFVLALVIAGMAYAGWLTFVNTDNTSEIRLDKVEMKADLDKAFKAGGQAMEKATDRAEELGDSLRKSAEDSTRGTDDVNGTANFAD